MLSKISNNLTFRANLELKNINDMVNVSPERIENIKEKFAQKTSEYPNITLKYDTYDNKEYLQGYYNDSWVCGAFQKSTVKKLFAEDDETVANKFAKLFNILRQDYNALSEVETYIAKRLGVDLDYIPESMDNDILDLKKWGTKNRLNEDPILREHLDFSEY